MICIFYRIQIRGRESGERVGPGRHQFEFVARDEEGNETYCHFQVKVIRYPTTGNHPNLHVHDIDVFVVSEYPVRIPEGFGSVGQPFSWMERTKPLASNGLRNA